MHGASRILCGVSRMHPCSDKRTRWRNVSPPRSEATLSSAADKLAEAVRTILKGFEEGVFVRAVDQYHRPDWTIRVFPFVRALAQAQKFVDDFDASKASEIIAPVIDDSGDCESDQLPQAPTEVVAFEGRYEYSTGYVVRDNDNDDMPEELFPIRGWTGDADYLGALDGKRVQVLIREVGKEGV